MKKNLLIVCIFSLAFIFNASARQIKVTVLDFEFSPKKFTATIGDTIHFVWAAGFHTTTSTSIPSGAADWDKSIDDAHTSFLYPVKKQAVTRFNVIFILVWEWLEALLCHQVQT